VFKGKVPHIYNLYWHFASTVTFFRILGCKTFSCVIPPLRFVTRTIFPASFRASVTGILCQQISK